MKKSIKKISIICLSFLFKGIASSFLFAQDIHYTQFNATTQNLNPAQAGMFNGDLRFVGNYRTQWAGISTPIITNSIATDARFKKQFMGMTPALGLQVNADKTGDSKLTTTQIYLSAAIIKKLTKDSTHLLNFAIQPGFTKKVYNTDALTYDRQYDGDNFDPTLNTGEQNANGSSISYFDAGAGVTYLWEKSSRKQLNIGVSFFHLNKPQQSFFNNGDIILDIKTVVSGIVEFPVAEKVDLLPTFLYQKQGKFNEAVLGLTGKYYLRPSGGMATAISLGFMFRNKDASNFVATMEVRNLTGGISYDINLSKLMEASNNRGGFELSLIYILEKNRTLIAKKRACPVYM